MEPAPSATKAVVPLSPSENTDRVIRLPVGVGLGVGALASLSLWAGIVVGIRALLH
jgi:hypothetical protein